MFNVQCLIPSQQTFAGLQDMSWRSLQHVLNVTIEDVLEDEKLLRWRRLEDALKTCLENMSWRRLEDISWRRLQDVSEANKIFTGDICI